jgi:catechol 2,3-dioxygenase
MRQRISFTEERPMDIGHVHLNVSDLDRSIAFYHDVLGLDVTLRLPKLAFLSCDGYHHHVALDSRVAAELGSPKHQGLHHFALRHKTRSELADSVRRAQAAGVPIGRAVDFYVLEAVFINDPDGNGIELSWDRPREEWPEDWATPAGLGTPRPLNLEELLATAAAHI